MIIMNSESTETVKSHKTSQKAAAWAVHGFTTSGIVLGFLGLNFHLVRELHLG